MRIKLTSNVKRYGCLEIAVEGKFVGTKRLSLDLDEKRTDKHVSQQRKNTHVYFEF